MPDDELYQSQRRNSSATHNVSKNGDVNLGRLVLENFNTDTHKLLQKNESQKDS